MRPILLCLTVLAAAQAVETGSPIDDLRLSVGVVLAPKVNELVSNASGATTDIAWDDAKRYNLRYSAEYVRGARQRGIGKGGMLWSAGLSYADLDLTPGVYQSGGSERVNTRPDLELHSKQYWAMGSLGYAARPRYTEFGDWHWEVAGVGRGGPTMNQTQGYDVFGNAVRKDDWGYGWELGARAGLVYADAGWIIGLSGEWAYGQTRSTFTMPNLDTSDLTITRNGPAVDLAVGWRF